MRIIKMTDEKKEKLSGYVEKLLSTAGKMMQCLETLEDEPDEDEEFGMGERRGYGNRMGMRDGYEGYGGYGERRGRDSRGRFM